MTWFTKLFNQERLKNTQPRPTELKNQNFTGVVQTIVEEAIMATAYWLIGLVNRSIEKAAVSPVETKASAAKPNALEEIVPKVVVLLEQFHEHSHSVNALAERLCQAEAMLKDNTAENSALEQSRQTLLNSIANLESRLVQAEALVKAVEAAQPIREQSDQHTAALESRIAHLEKLLSRYSVVPKLIEQNHQTIAALQNRLSVLEFPQNQNQHHDRSISAANVN